MLIFICPKPRGPTTLLKNAKNRFQIGFSYFQEGDTKTKIWSASRKRVVFSKGTLGKKKKTEWFQLRPRPSAQPMPAEAAGVVVQPGWASRVMTIDGREQRLEYQI